MHDRVEYLKEYRKRPGVKERQRIWTFNYRQRHPDRLREQKRRYRLRVVHETFAAYGGPICVCCGETEISFLTLDHINGDGAEHRRSIGRARFYELLKKQGYPNDKPLQVLCWNCQWGRRKNTICPHEQKQRKVVPYTASGT